MGPVQRIPEVGGVADWCELTLTRRCNQRCFFCYEDARSVARDPDLAEIRRLLETTRRHAEQVVLCGKEVLLRPDIIEIVRTAAYLGLRTVVFTNGQALARDGIVEQLVEAGCCAACVSFHFPDAETFARAARVKSRGFEQILAGLRAVATYNASHPDRPLGISTETDMSALNAGRLAEMRRTLLEALAGTTWKMRVASLLPTRCHDIGLEHALAPLDDQRSEIAEFVATHPPDLPLRFVKVPLCILPPGLEHWSQEVEYICQGTALTYNHANPEVVSTDTITPSVTRDLRGALSSHPYRWLCRGCGLAALCRFERVDWHHATFEPTRAQRPLPSRITVTEVCGRIDLEAVSRGHLGQLMAPLEQRFPEEEIFEALGATPEGAPRLVDCWIDRRPIAVLEFESEPHRLVLQLLPPSLEAGPLPAVVDYLLAAPTRQAESSDLMRRCLERLARIRLPEIERWQDTPWFDSAAAWQLRKAWNRFGSRLWARHGKFADWKTIGLRWSREQELRIELSHPSGERSVLLFRAPGKGAERLRCFLGTATLGDPHRGLIRLLKDLGRGWSASVHCEPRLAASRG
jgi:uncharacterized Fe-S cluster-containing radical SAM superfamily protein